ncbi:hypothetical protein LguiA_002285 [Lonicera macranthoides]
MFPLKREILAREVLKRLGNVLLELGNQHSQGREILAEPFDNQLRWIKIDLEFVGLKEGEDLIAEARRIVYVVGQFLESGNFLNGTTQKKREVVIAIFRRFRRMVANYPLHERPSLGLADISISMAYFIGDTDDDETKGPIFGHHLIDWIQGDQGSSTIASGGQVAGVTEEEDCFVGLDEQLCQRERRLAAD